MAASRVTTAVMPTKVSGDLFFATEAEAIRQVLNEHADELDALAFAGIAATDDHPAFATITQALTWVLDQPATLELVLPQQVKQNNLYVTPTGIWAPRRSMLASADPIAGGNWRLVAGFQGQASSVGSANISDATDAGRRMITAVSATAQRALLSNPAITKDQYGVGHPAFTNTDGNAGLYQWLIRQVLSLGSTSSVPTQTAAAPTVTGFLPDTAAVGATVAITGTGFTKATAVSFNGATASFQVINGATIVVVVPVGATTGPVSVSNATDTGTSAASFTVGASTTTPTPTPTPALTAALAISVASIVAGTPLTFEVTAGGGTAPYAYAVKATNNATGAVAILGSSATGSFTPQAAGVSYNIDATVTDSAGKVAQAITRTVQVTAGQTVNQLPVANAGDDLTITLPTSSAVLMGTASDPDADSLTYVWRQITGPNNATGLPATSLNVVVSNLMAGTYQFGFQATDSKGGKSSEDFVVVTANAAAGGTGLYPADTVVVGDSNSADDGPGTQAPYNGTPYARQLGLSTSNFPPSRIVNLATNGYTAEMELTKLQQYYAANPTTTAKQRIVLIRVGTNNWRESESYMPTGAGVKQNKYQITKAILDIIRLVRLNGDKPIFITPTPDRRRYQDDPTEDSRMATVYIDTCNLLLSLAKKYGAYGIVDLTANGFIGSVSAPITYANTYWIPDQIHLNAPGLAMEASYIAPVVQQVADMPFDTSWPDPGPYQIPTNSNTGGTGAGTGTGLGTDYSSLYAFTNPDFFQLSNMSLSATTLTANGNAGKWGRANSRNKAGTTSNTVIAVARQIIAESNQESLFGWGKIGTYGDYRDIDFGFQFKTMSFANSQGAGTKYGIRVFGYGAPGLTNASDTSVGWLPYTPGDILDVVLEKGRVAWYQNKNLLFALSLSVPPADYFVVAAAQPGGVITDISVAAANWIPRTSATVSAPIALSAATLAHVSSGVSTASGWPTKTSGNSAFDEGFINSNAFGPRPSGETAPNRFRVVLRHSTSGYVLGVHGGADDGVGFQEITAGFAIQTSGAPGEGWRVFVAGGANNGGTTTNWVPFVDGDELDVLFTDTQAIASAPGTSAAFSYVLAENAILDCSMLAPGCQVENLRVALANPVAVQ
jgi:hypothetical protein